MKLLSSNRIVINSSEGNHRSEIYDLSGKLLDTYIPPAGCYGVAWSPDQKWVGMECEDRLVFQSLEDSSLQHEIPFLPGEYMTLLSWSTTGRWISFFRWNESKGINAAPLETDGFFVLDANCLEEGGECLNQWLGPFFNDRRTFSYWASDDRSIAFWNNGLVVYSFPSRKVLLGSPINFQGGCQYTLDGKYITVNSEGKLYTIPLDGGEVIETDFNWDGNILGWVSTYPRPIFRVGAELVVTPMGDNAQLQSSPSLGSDVLELLDEGDVLSVIDGPVYVDHSDWWKIRMADGQTGWIAENPYWYTTP